MKSNEPQQDIAVYRDDYRMKLFVAAYVGSLHRNNVDPKLEALRAVGAFDEMFPPDPNMARVNA